MESNRIGFLEILRLLRDNFSALIASCGSSKDSAHSLCRKLSLDSLKVPQKPLRLFPLLPRLTFSLTEQFLPKQMDSGCVYADIII